MDLHEYNAEVLVIKLMKPVVMFIYSFVKAKTTKYKTTRNITFCSLCRSPTKKATKRNSMFDLPSHLPAFLSFGQGSYFTDTNGEEKESREEETGVRWERFESGSNTEN